MELREYLKSFFPGLSLTPSLYHQWNIGIHFELGEGMYQFKDDGRLNLEMFERVYSQSLALFNELFSDQDELLLVTNTYHSHRSHRRRPTKVYSRYIKNREFNYSLRQDSIPYVVDDEYTTSQFYLPCKKKDIEYHSLLKAACNKDFRIGPTLGLGNGDSYPDVFFINTSKHIIFYIYDDRGCEVIASKKEAIMPLYRSYKSWVAEYDREEIEKRLVNG